MSLSAPAIARLLLQKDDAAEESRWQELEEAILDQEVEIYREGIRALTVELAKQGLPTSLNDEGVQPDQERGPQGVEVFGFLTCMLSSADGLMQVRRCLSLGASLKNYRK